MMLARYGYVLWQSRRVRRFLSAADHATAIQRDVLLRKIRQHAESDFGKRHGFSHIRSVDDFRRQIPITTYDYYRDDIERVKQGDLCAMFGAGTRLLMFARTTGSTARSKFIPITAELFDQYRSGWNLWGLQTYADHLDLVQKKTLQFGSNWRQFFTEGGTPCGNISGLVAHTAPWIARSRFVLPSAVTDIDSTTAKHYTALRLALSRRDVGMIGTANPSTLVEVARLANNRRESLVRDIYDGTLAEDIELPEAVRSQLTRPLQRADPMRARELEQIVERTGRLRPSDVWAGLSVIAVWMGGPVGIYLPMLKPHYGEPALRDHGISSSEARMTIPLADGTTAGVVEFIHHFFEFIPVHEHDSADPTVLEAHELVEGQDYYILLTTSGGFYRYDIHDVVRCVGFQGQAPMLIFLNKGARFSSFTGEKLSEYQVTTAVQESFRQLEIPLVEFTLAPLMGDRLNYVLLLESGALDAKDDLRLAELVDKSLMDVNWEYAEKRQSGRILPVRVQRVAVGTWTQQRHERTRELGNFEHYKHPCLVADLDFVQRLTERSEARLSEAQ